MVNCLARHNEQIYSELIWSNFSLQWLKSLAALNENAVSNSYLCSYVVVCDVYLRADNLCPHNLAEEISNINIKRFSYNFGDDCEFKYDSDLCTYNRL